MEKNSHYARMHAIEIRCIFLFGITDENWKNLGELLLWLTLNEVSVGSVTKTLRELLGTMLIRENYLVLDSNTYSKKQSGVF